MGRNFDMQRYELEARRVRVDYICDLTVRAVLAADLAIRRAACRVLAWLAQARDPVQAGTARDCQ